MCTYCFAIFGLFLAANYTKFVSERKMVEGGNRPARDIMCSSDSIHEAQLNLKRKLGALANKFQAFITEVRRELHSIRSREYFRSATT